MGYMRKEAVEAQIELLFQNLFGLKKTMKNIIQSLSQDSNPRRLYMKQQICPLDEGVPFYNRKGTITEV
jgi:hypothetical protein